MTTEISTIETKFPGLVPGSRAQRIIQANLDGEPLRETDLVRIKTPAGGGTVWSYDRNGNTETADEIVGLIVGYGKRGYLWNSENPAEERPLVTSHDLVTGYRTNDKLGDVDAATLEQFRVGDRKYDWVKLADPDGPFGFGTARGAGKRVKESRLLAILPKGFTLPILVSIGPGSLADFMAFMRRCDGLIWERVVGLKLVKEKSADGIPYSKIIPRLLELVSEEEGEVARKLYYDPVQSMLDAPPFLG